MRLRCIEGQLVEREDSLPEDFVVARSGARCGELSPMPESCPQASDLCKSSPSLASAPLAAPRRCMLGKTCTRSPINSRAHRRKRDDTPGRRYCGVTHASSGGGLPRLPAPPHMLLLRRADDAGVEAGDPSRVCLLAGESAEPARSATSCRSSLTRLGPASSWSSTKARAARSISNRGSSWERSRRQRVTAGEVLWRYGILDRDQIFACSEATGSARRGSAKRP